MPFALPGFFRTLGADVDFSSAFLYVAPPAVETGSAYGTSLSGSLSGANDEYNQVAPAVAGEYYPIRFTASNVNVRGRVRYRNYSGGANVLPVAGLGSLEYFYTNGDYEAYVPSDDGVSLWFYPESGWDYSGVSIQQTSEPPEVALNEVLAGTYDFTTTDAIDGTIVVATEEGTYSAGISLSAATTYDLYSQGVATSHQGFMDTPVGYAIFPSTLSDSEIAQAEAAFVAEGAAPRSDFGSVASFSSAWRDCSSLTSFPAIDTSSGTNFSLAWNGCSSLTSFPQLGASSGINFGYTWYNCSSMATFPANFFDSWSPASVSSGVFNSTWDGCSSLTAQSVENILVSLDTSGIHGTNTGLSSGTQLADHTIDIDYDGTTLSSATTTAITNLKNKDWSISINSVIQ